MNDFIDIRTAPTLEGLMASQPHALKALQRAKVSSTLQLSMLHKESLALINGIGIKSARCIGNVLREHDIRQHHIGEKMTVHLEALFEDLGDVPVDVLRIALVRKNGAVIPEPADMLAIGALEELFPEATLGMVADLDAGELFSRLRVLVRETQEGELSEDLEFLPSRMLSYGVPMMTPAYRELLFMAVA